MRGDSAGLAEEREEIQPPRRRREDGWCVSAESGGGGHLRGVYGCGEGHRIDWWQSSDCCERRMMGFSNLSAQHVASCKVGGTSDMYSICSISVCE